MRNLTRIYLKVCTRFQINAIYFMMFSRNRCPTVTMSLKLIIFNQKVSFRQKYAYINCQLVFRRMVYGRVVSTLDTVVGGGVAIDTLYHRKLSF